MVGMVMALLDGLADMDSIGHLETTVDSDSETIWEEGRA